MITVISQQWKFISPSKYPRYDYKQHQSLQIPVFRKKLESVLSFSSTGNFPPASEATVSVAEHFQKLSES